MTSIGMNIHHGLNKERHMNLGSLIKALGLRLGHRLVPVSAQTTNALKLYL